MLDTQNSTLRIHTPHSGFTHSNTLSFECGALSIRHKSGASDSYSSIVLNMRKISTIVSIVSAIGGRKWTHQFVIK